MSFPKLHEIFSVKNSAVFRNPVDCGKAVNPWVNWDNPVKKVTELAYTSFVFLQLFILRVLLSIHFLSFHKLVNVHGTSLQLVLLLESMFE